MRERIRLGGGEAARMSWMNTRLYAHPKRRLAVARNGGGGDNTADQVHEQIRDGILSGEYRPNQRLVEEELARNLQVSRTPVREALLRLQQQGLVHRDRGWQARAEVESSAARLAASRISRDEVTRLEELIVSMERETNRRLINALNDEFHSVITQAARNHVLADLARATRINYWNFASPILFTQAQDEVVNSEHRQLAVALAGGDADLAASIARAHVSHTADIIAEALGLERRHKVLRK